MRLVRAILAVSCFALFCACASQSRGRICDGVVLLEGDLPLTRNERILICGYAGGSEGWRSVPLSQAEFQIRVLMQRRGYLYPRFERTPRELRVWSGPRQHIRELRIHGDQGLLDASKKRHMTGHPLIADKLDEIYNWALLELRTRGYPCPYVEVKGQAWNGVVDVRVEPGSRRRIGELILNLNGLDPQALARYQAMQPGDWYDIRATELTVARMLADGLFQSAYFTQVCRDGKVDLVLHSSLGSPRLLRLGFGASTEELPFADLWFKSSKLDERASSFTAKVHASPRIQSLSVGSELFWLPWSRRTYLGPRFRIERESEHAWEDLSAQWGADLGRLWDWKSIRWRTQGGPTVNYVNTVRGTGPDDVGYLSWEGQLYLMSYDFELFNRDQYEGWQAALGYRGQRKGVGSLLNADRLQFNAKYLWNIKNLSPPLLVLAVRGELISVAANAGGIGQEPEALPREYRIFYGGDRNLRGWSRKAIDNNGIGYLTSLYLGLELRFVEELPRNLQPLLLLDLARLGRESFILEEPVFTSVGLGMRWASPIGTLRVSAARGRILWQDYHHPKYPEEWVYFISFGQEF